MAGAVASGELSCAVATRDDEAELRAVLRSVKTPGLVSLRFEREPDYFSGENVAGAADTTIIVRRAGRLVCIGRCSRRRLWLGGNIREVGYLGELRMAPGTSGGAEILRAGYSYFAKLEAERPQGPADVYFTSMATGNQRARRVLVGGRLGLPRYEAWAALRTLVWPVRRRVSGGADVSDGEIVDAGELGVFLKNQASRFGLVSSWGDPAQAWSALARHGLAPEDFCVVRAAGRIVAAAGLWDQSAWRQVVIGGYGGALRWARRGLNLLSRATGRPGLPSEGGRLCQACLHALAVAEGHEGVLPVLLEKLERRARKRGIEWIAVTLDARDPLAGKLVRRSGARSYETELFRVSLPGQVSSFVPDGSEYVRPEAGLL